jgi:hypothetical protein
VFHLFKRAFLEYDFLFTSLHHSILASNNVLQNPLAPELLIQQDSLENLLKNKFESDKENLWKNIIERSSTNRFYLYVPKNEFPLLQLELWKSKLSDTSLENCYFHHSVYTQDFLLKTHFYSDNVESKVNYSNSEIDVIDKNEFKRIFEKVEPSSVLSKIDHNDLSFEMLLANYLTGKTNHSLMEAFFSKLEYFCWKFFVGELEILKGDMINGAYDYAKKSKKIFNFFEESASLTSLIKSDTRLMWLLDETLISGEPSYIRSNYSLSTFVDFINLQSNINQFDNNTVMSNEKIITLMEHIYNGDYLEALRLDISKGFGSFLFNNSNGHKVNLVTISYIYDMFRENSHKEIERLSVKI